MRHFKQQDLKLSRERFRNSLGLRNAESQVKRTATTPIVFTRSRNALRLLEQIGLGGSTLSSERELAEKRLLAGMSAGRPDRVSYRSLFEAGVDFKLWQAEIQREDSDLRLRRAVDAENESKHQRIGGGDGARGPAVERELAIRDALDERIAIIISYGVPLAERARILDESVCAEAERMNAVAEHNKLLRELAWAKSPANENLVIPGEEIRKRKIRDRETALRARRIAAEDHCDECRRELEAWAVRYPKIADSLSSL